MMPKEVIRKAEHTLPMKWCVEHGSLKRPDYKIMCWESSVWTQDEDCHFVDAEVLLFPERPPA